jgi:polar amino acid transport system substrate-binding protein
LERVEGGVLRAGVTENDPWVRLDADRPTGVEIALVERFAQELGAAVEWVDGSEAELIGALHRHELDLVVGGLAAETPWQDKVAITRPYLTTRTVVGVPTGQPVPAGFAGVEVAVQEGDAAADLVERLDAVPVRVETLDGVDGPAALDEWLLDDYALADSGITLEETQHVMAVPLGENGWQVRLERFLAANRTLIDDLLEQEGHP